MKLLNDFLDRLFPPRDFAEQELIPNRKRRRGLLGLAVVVILVVVVAYKRLH